MAPIPLDAGLAQDPKKKAWRPTRSVVGDMFDRQFQLLEKELAPHKHGAHAKVLGNFCRQAYVRGRDLEEEQIEAQKRRNAYFEKGPVKRRNVAEARRPAAGHDAHWKRHDSVSRCFEKHVPPIEASDSDLRFQEWCEKTGKGNAKARPQSAPAARVFRLNCPYFKEATVKGRSEQTVERLLDAGWSHLDESCSSAKGKSERKRPQSAVPALSSGLGRSSESQHHEPFEKVKYDRGWKPPAAPFGMSNVASTPALPTQRPASAQPSRGAPAAGAPGRGLVLELRVQGAMRRGAFRGRRHAEALNPCPAPPKLDDMGPPPPNLDELEGV